jgi:hypothetical protein
MDQAVGALIAAAALLLGIWLGYKFGAAQSRKDRLRLLYSDVLRAAVRRSPRELGYRASDDHEGPTGQDIDELIARLMVEGRDDGDKIRSAFWAVVNRSDIFFDDKRNAKGDELLKSRQAVIDSMTELQRLVHKRIK